MTHHAAEHSTAISPFRTAWFEVAKMEAGVYLVSEPGHVNSWLIEGSKSAVLFDTGLGVANIRKVAEEMPDPEAFLSGLRSTVPLGRLGTADDIARIALFLASDESAYTSGAVIPCDGGLAAYR